MGVAAGAATRRRTRRSRNGWWTRSTHSQGKSRAAGADDCVVTKKHVKLLNVDRSLTDEIARWLAPTDLRPAVVPAPLVGLVHAVAAARPEDLSRNDPTPDTAAERQAAVLILVATDGAD